MKVQEVILRAIAKRMTWWQAVEVIGISDRQMRRWRRRWEKCGYDGLLAPPTQDATLTPHANNPVLGSGGPRRVQFGLKLTY